MLFEQRELSFSSLAALPSNVEAIEAALLFCAGYSPLVAVVGPSGWGKSHLLRAVAYRLSLDGQKEVEPIGVQEFLASPSRIESGRALLLDDVQEVMGKPRQRMALRMALERRVRSSRPAILVFTSPKPTRQLKTFLPCPRDWTIATIHEPQPAERVCLLNQMSVAEGLALSPRLVKILADRMHGNGRTLAGALKRLRASGVSWVDANETLRALGVLDPFFADNSAWDLKLKMLKIAEASRAQFTRSTPQDLALYAMLHVAGLGEAEVARAASINPGEAYQRAARFGKQVESCEVTAAQVRQFVEIVVGSLARE
ncbi:DnaA ATPase domain-containing protein [Fimbriimonas ginsengisoli]|uniref:Chromosomal replication initiator protein DnaA n=1 Tax=Fimbriimonas ginsengisoli Gsoil 348 TaxID=661478 RepID=A0A068NLA6_FIMGI|nr:DnaA/Hda family protein [Fimbriimonas ginsengisoli]AIE84261.1 chromosomal replication initiator protein DnaA [Fimbriimonas ginsengisoli Gsoil 348]